MPITLLYIFLLLISAIYSHHTAKPSIKIEGYKGFVLHQKVGEPYKVTCFAEGQDIGPNTKWQYCTNGRWHSINDTYQNNGYGLKISDSKKITHKNELQSLEKTLTDASFEFGDPKRLKCYSTESSYEAEMLIFGYEIKTTSAMVSVNSSGNGEEEISPDVTLDCSVKQAEMPSDCSLSIKYKYTFDIHWYWMNNSQIKDIDGKIKIKTTGNSSSIKIISARPEDCAAYICQIEIRDNAKVNVRNLSESAELFGRPEVERFIPASKNAVQGDPLTLRCKATGYPINELVWFKDGIPLTPSEHLNISSFGLIPNGTLSINSLEFSDEGQYECFASNYLSNSSEVIDIKVKDRLAALWPFLGICCEVAVLCVIIFFCERRHQKKLEEKIQEEETANGTLAPDQQPLKENSNRRRQNANPT